MHQNPRDGLPESTVEAITQHRSGAIWAATRRGLVRLEGSTWYPVGQQWNYPSKVAHYVFVDHRGTLWVATGEGVAFLPQGQRRFEATSILATNLMQLAETPDRTLWLADGISGLWHVPMPGRDHEQLERVPIPEGVTRFVFDRDGVAWAAASEVYRIPFPAMVNNPREARQRQYIENFGRKDGLSNDRLTTALEDREGNLWFGGVGGLDRFRAARLTQVSLPPRISCMHWRPQATVPCGRPPALPAY